MKEKFEHYNLELQEVLAEITGLDAVSLQPAAVVVEVAAHAADEQGPESEHAHAEADVRGHPSAPDVEVVDEEAQAHVGQLIREQLVGEAAGIGHEVVGRDGPGDGDAHGR